MRKNRNAQIRWHKPLKFKDICKALGIRPNIRVKLVRILKEGENDKL